MGVLLDSGPIRTGDVAVVAVNIDQALWLATQAPELPHRLNLVMVGEPIKGIQYSRAYAYLDLMPELRTPREDEWFKRFEQRLPSGVNIVYLD